MSRRTVSILAVLALLAGGVAGAIPPPWTIEEAKGKADLIFIAKTAKIEPVENVPGANRRVGIEPVLVLKGKHEKRPAPAKLALLFFQRPEPKPGPIRAHSIGGVGYPKPREGDIALMFLRKDRQKEGHFRIACGSFGYVRLNAKTKDELAAVRKRIAMYQQWCQRIKDENVRTAMEDAYQKTLAFLEKAAKAAPKP